MVKKKTLLRDVFFGIILLTIFHFETVDIFGIKISHLWKGVVLFFIAISTFNKKLNLFIYRPYILIALIQLFHLDFSGQSFNAFFNFLITLFIPLIGVYSLKFSSKQLRHAIIYFATFFILSFLPYQLGFLQSLEEGYALSDFGSKSSGIIGPFQTAHSASLTLSTSLIVIIYFWFDGLIKKRFFLPLFFLGFYFLIITYVRTGLAMFVLGMIPLFFTYLKSKSGQRVRLIFVTALISLGTILWIFNNETLMKRIYGERIYNAENNFDSLGSGRGKIYKESLNIFIESTPIEKIIGMGQNNQMDRIYQKIGIRVVSHNGFLDLLLVNGILGLFLFLIFLRKIIRSSKFYKSNYKTLLLSIFALFLTMCLFQGYNWINTSLILVLVINLNYKSQDSKLTSQQLKLSKQ